MDRSIKERWIAALCSGNYAQTRGWLCVEDSDGNRSFCAVGVLCDLYIKDHKDSSWCRPNPRFDQMCFSASSQIGFAVAPSVVCNWANVSLEDLAQVDLRNDIGDPYEIDRRPYSFLEIADYIQYNF